MARPTAVDTEGVNVWSLLVGTLSGYAPSRLQYASGAGWASITGAPLSTARALGPAAHTARPALRRVVASGGAYYPGELYAVVAGDRSLSGGVYHYHALHDALELVRSGPASARLSRAIGQPSGSGGVDVVVACRLWKNASKYGSFGYRLSCLDLGLLIGQLQVSAPVASCVHFLFIDDHLDRLLGLDPAVEAAYAVIRLATGGTDADGRRAPARSGAEGCPLPGPARSGGDVGESGAATAAGLDEDPRGADAIAVQLHERSRIAGAADLAAAHRVAAVYRSAEGPVVGGGERTIALPPRTILDLRAVRGDRRSATAFGSEPVGLNHVATVCANAVDGSPSDVGGTGGPWPPLSLYCVATAVTGLPPGAYRYDALMHRLEPGTVDDLRSELRSAVLGLDHRLRAAPFSLFIVGHLDAGLARLGDRWYRIVAMAAGMATQRACLAAAAMGIGCRPNLGFTVDLVDRMLGTPTGHAPLIHLMLGAARPRAGFLEVPLD